VSAAGFPESERMNPNRLFVASCIALVASAFSFVIRQDVLPAWEITFGLNHAQAGAIGGSAFWGMAVAMSIASFVVDAVGMKRMLGLAFLCHLVGTLLTVTAPYLNSGSGTTFYLLYAATFMVGCANGLVEIGINPLAATLYPTEKTHRLNILHAWWPGGLFLGGLLSILITYGLGQQHGLATLSKDAVLQGWQIKIGLIFVPTLLYGALFFSQKFPVTERVASGVSTAEMLGQVARPMFLLWAFCMLLTASTELAPQGMQSLVLEKTAGINGTYVLLGTSAIMFTLRHFAGPIAHRLSPVGMLAGSAVLSAIGLFSLSHANNAGTVVMAATIFGLGIVYFWPTMLGVTAERFPRGGAFLLGLMGCIGNVAVGLVMPWMGSVNDKITLEAMPSELKNRVVVNSVIDPEKVKALPEKEQADVLNAQKEGAKWSFRYVAALPVLLVVIFGGIALSDRARGGYRPEVLTGNELSPAELASDF
jgi:MFS family permease